MKKILITGCAGFVGSNLAKELLRKKYRVIGLDNLSQGPIENIRLLLKNKNFTFQKSDVRDGAKVERAARGADCIVHLAAYKIPRYGNAMATLKINTQGTEAVLEAARKYNCKVVFSSTSDIYGKNKLLPFNEESDSVLGQTYIKRWAYAVSKIFDEHLCYAYQEEYALSIVILRYFGGYGPNQNLTWWGGPQSVFIAKALRQEPLPIHGDGSQTRTFTYISDMVAGTVLAIEKDEAVGQAFNIGNTREIAICDLAGLIWKMINPRKEPLLNFVPYSSFSGKYEDVVRRVPDISKARKLLGFAPKVDIEKGLAMTIAWQKGVSEKK